MENYRCKICGNTTGNQDMIVLEVLFRTFNKFIYFKCSHCGCLQITETPENLSKYYPANKYYSYNSNIEIEGFFTKLLLNAYFKGYIPEISRHCKMLKIFHLPLRKWFSLIKNLPKTSAILDVGCGDGLLLNIFSVLGYTNLQGIDPFIEKDKESTTGIKIYKKDVFNLSGKYDLIMMHHSFEHMDKPLDVLQQCHNLLDDNGKLLVRIPVSDCYAFRKYGTFWQALDAPRHLFLHTKRSIAILANKSGFDIERVIYDSTNAQIKHSESYSLYSSLKNENKYTFVQKIYQYVEAKRLNLLNDGDQACFVLKKSNTPHTPAP
jgi:SAM-dependent methyltransferase